MVIHTASDSLLGDRDENQDRLSIVRRDDTVLAAVVDGMGGHEAGAEAAQTAIDTMEAAFAAATLPLPDMPAFLGALLRDAHEAVVRLGASRTLGAKPRATCVVALVQARAACWAHIGDSRVYWLRDEHVLERTRDHSHVEILLREGLITEAEFRDHPLRNYVEYCLGGDPGEPTMTISEPRTMHTGDMLLLCSDGVWSGMDDDGIAGVLARQPDAAGLREALAALLEEAVAACAPQADNTTAAVLWLQDPSPGE